MNIRALNEEIESKTLRKEAMKSSESKGRINKDTEKCNLRTCFQVDRDRIIHCKAFRRLSYKTQVFIHPKGDHYRTRLTHTLEVSQIGRSIAKALQLNETLTEAIALGHDLGHTPFGHLGEKVLNKIYKEGFHHVAHSVRIIEFLENRGKGLNLTHEVVDGIKKHSKGKGPIITDDPNLKAETLEGQIIRLADIFAYINHDIDDAIRAGLLTNDRIPQDIKKTLGPTVSKRLERMISDVLTESLKNEPLKITMSSEVNEAILKLREFMFNEVYENPLYDRSLMKISKLITDLFEFYLKNKSILEEEMHFSADEIGIERLACDHIAGMTDRYAINTFEELFMPTCWEVL